MSSKIFSISVPEKTLKKLDSMRGLVPRSAYIVNILSSHLKLRRKRR